MSLDSDHAIIELAERTELVRPFNRGQVEPASYDVRLSNDFKVFQRDDTLFIDLNAHHGGLHRSWLYRSHYYLVKRRDVVLLTIRLN